MNDLQRLIYVLIRAGAPIDKTIAEDGKVTVGLPDYIVFEDSQAVDHGFDW